ncbi:hypothetical protein FACS1894105_14430 [Clostridia bacterium]|nr:hypothetical protein FACS1894105_14430 [Clostridia bacterium]
MLINVNNIDIYADKAYCDATWKADLKERNVCLTTPIKMNKGETEPDAIDEMYNSVIASIRQPIESFFSWLQRVTRIQIASSVRSTNGLRSFVFARLAVAALF